MLQRAKDSSRTTPLTSDEKVWYHHRKGDMGALNQADRLLVKRMIQADSLAFSEFFDRLFPKLFRFALSRVNFDRDGAEEVAQETLCKVIRKLRTYRGEAPLFTWCCTFCRHEISAYHRKHRGAKSHLSLEEEIPEIQTVLETLADFKSDVPEASALRLEVQRQVQSILATLPENYSKVLQGKYLYGYSVKEIAESMNSTPKAIESLLTRARSSFRQGFIALGSQGSSWPGPIEGLKGCRT